MHSRFLLIVPALFALLPSALAQSTRPAAVTPPPEDDIIELGVFEVSAQSQTGYIASESMTGSRMPTKIIDLPYNIDVITSEFFDDFVIIDDSQMVEGGVISFDRDEANMNYAGGSSDGVIRGVTTAGQLYNGFWQPSGTPVSSALKDRTEVLKGPSAGIYGQTSPGGIKNTTSKQPKFKPSTKLNLRFGSYDLMSAKLEATGPLTKKTAYLAILDVNDRKYTQAWRKTSTYTAAFSLLHKFDPTAQLRIEFVGVKSRSNAPANRIPFLYDSSRSNPTAPEGSKAGMYTGFAMELAETSGTGPNSWGENDNYSIYAIFEKRINRILSYRLGATYTYNHIQAYNVTALTLYDSDPTHATAGDPYNSSAFYGLTRTQSDSSSYSAPGFRRNNQDTGGIQGDMLAHYKIGKIECRSLFTFDFTSRYVYQNKWAMPQEFKNAPPAVPSAIGDLQGGRPDPAIFPWDPKTIGTMVNGRLMTPEYFWANYWLPVVNPLDPTSSPYVDLEAYPQYDIYHVPDFNTETFIETLTSHSRRNTIGLMFRQQMTLWDNLIVFGSIRMDYVNYNYNETGPSKTYARWLYPQYEPFFYYTKGIRQWSSTSWTPSVGLNYRPKRWIALFANYSTSFKPSDSPASGSSKDIVSRSTVSLPNEESKGFDYGIKFTFMNDRLTGTICGFYIDQYNVKVKEEDPVTLEEMDVAAGTILSRGVEVSVNYFMTKSWSVNAAYYRTNAKWTYSGNDLDRVSRQRANTPPDIVTFKTKYSFQNGLFKGLNLFGQYQYIGSCPASESGSIKTTTTVDPATGKAIGSVVLPGSNNNLRNIIIPSAYLINIGANYSFKIPSFTRNAKHSIQVNINNLLNDSYITQSRGVGDTRAIIVGYGLQF